MVLIFSFVRVLYKGIIIIILFCPLAACTALTELVLNDTNAQQIVQVCKMWFIVLYSGRCASGHCSESTGKLVNLVYRIFPLGKERPW